jgi:hypothetical protein
MSTFTPNQITAIRNDLLESHLHITAKNEALILELKAQIEALVLENEAHEDEIASINDLQDAELAWIAEPESEPKKKDWWQDEENCCKCDTSGTQGNPVEYITETQSGCLGKDGWEGGFVCYNCLVEYDIQANPSLCALCRQEEKLPNCRNECHVDADEDEDEHVNCEDCDCNGDSLHFNLVLGYLYYCDDCFTPEIARMLI